MQPNQPPKQPSRVRTAVTRGGVVVALATAVATGIIAKWEDGPNAGKGAVVYADKLARNIPTACKGITNAVSPIPVIVGEYWSAERCDEVGKMVLEKSQLKLADCLTGYVTQNAFDALSSFGHNVGMYAACSSSAVGLINAGELLEGCRRIAFTQDGSPNWSYADGKYVPGLFSRRKDESSLCAKGGK